MAELMVVMGLCFILAPLAGFLEWLEGRRNKNGR